MRRKVGAILKGERWLWSCHGGVGHLLAFICVWLGYTGPVRRGLGWEDGPHLKRYPLP